MARIAKKINNRNQIALWGFVYTPNTKHIALIITPDVSYLL